MRTRAGASFGALLKLFLRARRERGLARRCEPALARALHSFRAHLLRRETKDVRGASEADVVCFLSSLKRQDGRALSPWTVSSWRYALGAFFRFLEKRGLLLTDPTAHVKLARCETLPRRVLTVAQAERLMTAPSASSLIGKRDRAILELLYLTAIRGSECARLDLSDVDLAGGTLLVRDGKGRRDRVVPLVGRAKAALQGYLCEARPSLVKDPAERGLFLSHERERRRLTLSGIECMVARHARAARLAPVFPHALRHSCATHLLQGGAHVRHVQELLGHKSLLSTMLYTRLDTSALAEVLRSAHPRERVRSGRPARAGG